MTVIIGMNPSVGTEAMLPGSRVNGAADNLLRISGLSRETYMTKFVRFNLLNTNYWSPTLARHNGAAFRKKLRGCVLVLGRDTWKALDLPNIDWFDASITEQAVYILLPHPSGRNRMLNNPKTRKIMRRVICNTIS